MKRFLILGASLLGLAACQHQAAGPVASVHYVVGAGWQGDGVWFYPRESFDYHETGIASVTPADAKPHLTADGEVFDNGALAAAHQTLQLPAIARVTNLENGRIILVRINERGPKSPGRLIELTQRAADLLDIPPTGAAPVRIDVEPQLSQSLAASLHAPSVSLAITAAPRDDVGKQVLPGSTGGDKVELAAAKPGQDAAAQPVPDKLPEQIWLGKAGYEGFYLDAGDFGSAEYAEQRRASLAGSAAWIDRRHDGKIDRFGVMIGPLHSIEDANAAMQAAIAAGVTDAHIVVQ